MPRQLADSSPRRSKPYARITTRSLANYKGIKGLGVNVQLQLSLGAIREYGLKMGERVDIIWERYNETWGCPILIIKRHGTQRVLSGNRKSIQTPSALRVSIGTAVSQFDIPILQHRLPILDYIDDEIWIDFGLPSPEQVKKEVATERFNINFGDYSQTVRWGKEYKRVLSEVAKSEGLSFNALIIRTLDFYIQDNFPIAWEHLEKLVNRPLGKGGRKAWEDIEHD